MQTSRWGEFGPAKLTLGVMAAISTSSAVRAQFIFDRPSFDVPDQPLLVAAGDLNGDGIDDLVVMHWYLDGSERLSVTLSNPDGTFEPAALYNVFGGTDVAIVDLDGDSDLDLAIAYGSLWVCLNRGDGVFDSISIHNSGLPANQVETTDMDNDGDQDVILSGLDTSVVHVLVNSGNATFAPPHAHALPGVATSLVVADFNGDDRPDCAAAIDLPTTDGVALLLHDQRAGFEPAQTVVSGAYMSRVAAGDMDGDGDADLAFCSAYADVVGFSLNDGSAAFGTPSSAFIQAGANSLAIADLNGNNLADFVLDNEGKFAVDVLLDPINGIAVSARLPSGLGTNFVATGDLNADGHIDIAAALRTRGTVCAHINNGRGGFETGPSATVGDFVQTAATGDVDCDGDVDVVVAHNADRTFSLLRNNGDGSLSPQEEDVTPNHAFAAALGDLDGDGLLDLAVACGGGILETRMNHGGGFRSGIEHLSPGTLSSVVIADLNGDGLPDLAATSDSPEQINVHINLGSAEFAPAVSYPSLYRPRGVTAADMDGDGDLDMVTASSAASHLAVHLNLGDGTFAPETRYVCGPNPRSVALADVDGDGDADALVALGGSNNVGVLLNDGGGALSISAIYPVSSQPMQIVAADLNSDGRVDVAVTCYWKDIVCVLLGEEDGTFGAAQAYASERFPLPLAAADLDSDGDVDLISGGLAARLLRVHINRAVDSGPCPGDADGDGVVGFSDLNLVLNRFGAAAAASGPREAADVDGSGVINLDDLSLVLSRWESECSTR